MAMVVAREKTATEIEGRRMVSVNVRGASVGRGEVRVGGGDGCSGSFTGKEIPFLYGDSPGSLLGGHRFLLLPHGRPTITVADVLDANVPALEYMPSMDDPHDQHVNANSSGSNPGAGLYY